MAIGQVAISRDGDGDDDDGGCGGDDHGARGDACAHDGDARGDGHDDGDDGARGDVACRDDDRLRPYGSGRIDHPTWRVRLAQQRRCQTNPSRRQSRQHIVTYAFEAP